MFFSADLEIDTELLTALNNALASATLDTLDTIGLHAPADGSDYELVFGGTEFSRTIEDEDFIVIGHTAAELIERLNALI